MEDSDVRLHRLADTTYRNNEELSGELRRLVAAAKAYHRAMQGLSAASSHFTQVLHSVGNKAANLPGSVRKLGDGLEKMVTGYNQIGKQYEGVIHSLNTDFIVPLETKLDSEEKNLSSMHKAYKQENSKREALLAKSSEQLKAMKKKKSLTTNQQEKQAQLIQILNDQEDELHLTRVEGLRKALLEERKLYCFVMDHLGSVIHNEIAFNAMSHQVLSTQVNDLVVLSSSPNQLPPESAALLVDPRSPRAFPHAGGGDEIGVGNTPKSEQKDVPQTRTRRISCRVKALYPHQASGKGQLEFNLGDLVDALDVPQDGWQYGENTRTGRTGWFPVQFVETIWPAIPAQSAHSSASLQATSGSSPAPNLGQSPLPYPDKDY